MAPFWRDSPRPHEPLGRQVSSPEGIKAPRAERPTQVPFQLKRIGLVGVLGISLLLNLVWLVQHRASVYHHCSAPVPKPHELALQEKSKAPLMIGRQQCSTPSLEALRRHLGNVVLLINVNDDIAAKNSSAFLRDLYGRFFLDTVVIGPNPLPKFGVSVRAHKPWRKRWPYAYYYFPTLVARFPNADGYLWMNADVALNYWQLLKADTSKLWLPDTPKCWKEEKEGCSRRNVTQRERCLCQGTIPFQNGEKAGILDGWSSTLWHKKLVRKAWWGLDREFKRQHIQSMNSTSLYHKRTVDVFYVPRRLSITMAFRLMPAFVEAGVWSEVAIPMMFHAMEPPSEYDTIFKGVVYRWEEMPGYNPLTYWNSSQAAFHHWNVATDLGKEALLKAFLPHDPCLEIPLKQLGAYNNTSAASGSQVDLQIKDKNSEPQAP